MRWTIEEDKKIKKLYTQEGFTFEELEKITGRSVSSLNQRLSKLKVKRRKPIKFKLPSEMTPALARIHAHVCGDGCIYCCREKDCYGPWAKYRRKNHRLRYFLVYTNYNKDLLKEFRNDIFSTFNIRGKRTFNNSIKVTSKKAYELLKSFGADNSYDWYIPKEITNGSREIMKNWIRAFFDDEAYFNDRGRIRVKCVNKHGLEQLNKMINKFVPCNLMPKQGFYWGKTVCLSIKKKDASRFFSKIGSVRYKPV